MLFVSYFIFYRVFKILFKKYISSLNIKFSQLLLILIFKSLLYIFKNIAIIFLCFLYMIQIYMPDSALPYFLCFAYNLYFFLCLLKFFLNYKIVFVELYRILLRPGLKVTYLQIGLAFAHTSHHGNLIKRNRVNWG